MRRNIIGIIVLLMLVAIAAYLFLSEEKSTIPAFEKEFAVKDTASITKIFMVNKANQRVLLERKGGKWILNKKYPARVDLLNVLLKTIANVRAKAPVLKTSHDNIVTHLATNATKVEIYTNNELRKTYYVGEATKDHQGTYMLLQGSKRAYITELPGFFGYLSSRYTINEDEWRDKSIFNYLQNSIYSVSVVNYLLPENSFSIINDGKGNFELFDKDSTVIEVFDTNAVALFLQSFEDIHFEAFIRKDVAVKVDSLSGVAPRFSVKLNGFVGPPKSIVLYNRPNYKGDMNDEGVLFEYDIDRMYGITENNELVIAQYYVFDPLLKSINDFIKK